MTSEEWLIGFNVIPTPETCKALDAALEEQRQMCADAVIMQWTTHWNEEDFQECCLNAIGESDDK